MGFVNLQKITTIGGIVSKRKNGPLHGEAHPAAKLTDSEVETIRRLHEVDRWGYKKIAVTMECSASTVAAICKWRRRAFV